MHCEGAIMFDTPTTRENVGKRATVVYNAGIRHLVEPEHHGRFIAIEPDSGDYVIGDKIGEVILEMRAKRPNALLSHQAHRP